MPSPYTEAGWWSSPPSSCWSELGLDGRQRVQRDVRPAGTLGRDSMHDVVLTHRLRDALRWLNPQVPDEIREEALAAVAKDRSVMDRVRANREVYDLIRDGYRAEWQDEHGEAQYATVQYVDFRTPSKNDWLAASQVWVAGDLHRRRADTVLFVNGIPLVLMEFKEPNRPVKAAYDENLTDYRDTIPQLFCPERVRDAVERVRGEGRLDLRAVGVLRRLEGDRRRRQRGVSSRWRRRSAAPARRTGCSTWSRTSSPTSSGPAG